MKTLNLTKLNSYPYDQDSKDFYSDILNGIHNINPIKGYEIGINTGTPNDFQSNFTIITFQNKTNDYNIIDAITEFFKPYRHDGIDSWTHYNDDTLIIEFAY